MSEPRQKDWLDVCIDFFFGALFGVLAMSLFFSPRSQQFYGAHWEGRTVWISTLAASLICGSLAGISSGTPG